MGVPDLALHWAIRGLAGACLVLFVGSLFFLSFPAFVGAIWSGSMAYILVRVDVERHPVKRDTSGIRADDSREPPTEADGKAIYPFQAAGIPITYETRSRWARKRG